MKVGILAGGVGSRISEETEVKPKPMVEIGGKPILWHIMKHYSHYGFKEFVIALGYKGEFVKRWMIDYGPLAGDLTVDIRNGAYVSHAGSDVDDWTVSLVDTGQGTATGGRIKRLAQYLGPGTFMATLGDGVSDIDLPKLLAFHRSHGKLATVTAVRPPARFGHLELDGPVVREFSEKPQGREGWINGGFWVFEPGILDYIEGDGDQLEHGPLPRLAEDGQLMAYRHESFWQCMDTLRDKQRLEELWRSGSPPWRLWA